MKVVFRTDSSTRIGSGHLMRCLTLAEGLREKGATVSFVCRDLPGDLRAMVSEKGFKLFCLQAPKEPGAGLDWNQHAAWLGVPWQQDAEETLHCLRQAESFIDWLIVDHYALDQQWESQMRPQVKKIMVIDDLADRRHDCDLLLDQNLYDDLESRYQELVQTACQQLLGPRYALLRSEFTAARKQLRRRDGKLRSLLVFYGGADSTNDTIKALEAIRLARLQHVEIDVVIGAANSNMGKIEEFCWQLGARVHCQVSNMAELMTAADLMLCAGGTTTWERCALGLPGVVTATAMNQQAVAENCARNGLSFYLGLSRAVTPQRIADALVVLSAAPASLQMYIRQELDTVDGRGLQRVAGALMPPPIEIRPAVMEDCDAVHEWRNDDKTRQYIFNPAPIPLDAHREWFRSTLGNSDCILLIGEIGDRPVGVVRYDLLGDKALISVYLVPGIQGQGIGTRLICAGTDWIKQNRPALKVISAEILSKNIGSIHAFERAGYIEYQRTYQKGLS